MSVVVAVAHILSLYIFSMVIKSVVLIVPKCMRERVKIFQHHLSACEIFFIFSKHDGNIF